MLHRNLIIEALISLYDKKISKTEFLAEIHDAIGMLRAGRFQAAAIEVEKAKDKASSTDINESREEIKSYLESALDLFDKEMELKKK